MSKLKSTQHIEVKIDLDEMDLTKAESKATDATDAEIKEYVLEKNNLKVLQLYIAQVKRKHGIIERINYNTGAGYSPTRLAFCSHEIRILRRSVERFFNNRESMREGWA